MLGEPLGQVRFFVGERGDAPDRGRQLVDRFVGEILGGGSDPRELPKRFGERGDRRAVVSEVLSDPLFSLRSKDASPKWPCTFLPGAKFGSLAASSANASRSASARITRRKICTRSVVRYGAGGAAPVISPDG